MPRPMTTIQWNRDQGSRSSRAGTLVSMVPEFASIARCIPSRPRVTHAGCLDYAEAMLRCRLLGHRYRFTAEGALMRWDCARCGTPGGSKTYPSPEQAARYASAFDAEDPDDLGRRRR